MFTSTICSISPFLLSEPFTFLTYMGLSNFFSLNPCFLTNSELITSFIKLLSNNASTVIPSYISILSSSIFTITSLKRSPLSRSHINVLSVTLASIANLLLLLRSNQDLLDFLLHLNYYYCPILLPFSYSFLFPCFYSALLYVQNLHMCNNSFYSYLYPWCMSFLEKALPSVKGSPSLHLFSSLLPLEQVPWKPTVEASLVSLAKLEAMTVFACMPPSCSTLGSVPHYSPSFLSTSLLLSYFPSNFYLG